MKWVVRQKESVLPNSFFSRTTRDNCHGYLKTSTGAVQAPAKFSCRADRNDVSSARTRQLSQSGALRGVARAHVRAALCAALPVVDVSRAGH